MDEQNKDVAIEKTPEFKYYKTQLWYRMIIIVCVAICVTTVIASSITYALTIKRGVMSLEPIVTGVNNNKENDISTDTIESITNNLNKFNRFINAYYKGDIDKDLLLTETIKGYVKGLGDEYSEYFTKEDLEEFEMQSFGNYYGIGIQMIKNDAGNIEIATVFEDTPAQESGVEVGDIIAYINDESFIGKTPEDAANKIKGEGGTTVKIVFLRGTETIELNIERREIKIYHVSSRIIDGNIGYMFLYTFDNKCSDEIKEAMEELKAQGADRFILDLRFNTGGLVDEAEKIAGLFTNRGSTIYYMVDANNTEKAKVTANNPVDTESPIVVLINKYSASASEILTGALKDQRNAVVVGNTSYGKGVMQNMFKLTDGSALKLTFAEYITPNKNKINKEGIKPDYEVDLTANSKIDGTGEKSIEDTQLDKAVEVIKEM